MNRNCVCLTLREAWNGTCSTGKKYFFNISHEVKPGFLFKKTLNRDGQ